MNCEHGVYTKIMDSGDIIKPALQELKNAPRVEMVAQSIPNEEHPTRNEDSFFYSQSEGVFAVFDGVSHPARGDVASRQAKDSVSSELFKSQLRGLSFEEFTSRVYSSLIKANESVFARAQREGEMGTTASVGAIWEGPGGEKKLLVGNVGDSRVYIFRTGKLTQVTLDDGIVRGAGKTEEEDRLLQAKFNNVTDLGRDLPDQFEQRLFLRRNILTQMIGGEKKVIPRLYRVDLKAGDLLLACSDGISDNLADFEIEEILKTSRNLDEGMHQLLFVAQGRSRNEGRELRAKPDDMTGILVKV